MKRILLCVIILFSAAGISAQDKTRSYIIDGQLAPRDHNVDFQNLRLEVDFIPEQGLVNGKVTHVFSPLRMNVDSIWFDGIDMIIKSVTLNGSGARFVNYKSGITVFSQTPLKWLSTDSITIHYECTPRKGLYFIGWNDAAKLSRTQIWSQGQGIDNRNWIPMYDEMNDKIVSEMIVRFNSDYKVLANGTLLGRKSNKDGTDTWHYKISHQHAPYLIMLGIGKYDIKQTKSASGVPLNLYYYPDWKERVETTYQKSEDMIDFFENEFGFKYPWESYSRFLFRSLCTVQWKILLQLFSVIFL